MDRNRRIEGSEECRRGGGSRQRWNEDSKCEGYYRNKQSRRRIYNNTHKTTVKPKKQAREAGPVERKEKRREQDRLGTKDVTRGEARRSRPCSNGQPKVRAHDGRAQAPAGKCVRDGTSGSCLGRRSRSGQGLRARTRGMNSASTCWDRINELETPQGSRVPSQACRCGGS